MMGRVPRFSVNSAFRVLSVLVVCAAQQAAAGPPGDVAAPPARNADSHPEVQRAYERLHVAVHEKDFEGFDEAVDALRKLGAASVAVPVLVDVLEQNEEFRWQAAFALGDFGADAKDAVPKVTALLKHPEESVREAAVYVLGNLGSAAKPAIPALVAAQDDSSKSVRDGAISALASVGPETIPHLVRALQHPDPYVRRRSADELGHMDVTDIAVTRSLEATLKDSDLSVRVTAAAALCDLRQSMEATIPVLIEGIDQENEALRRKAIWALEGLGPIANAARPALLKAILDWDDAGRFGVDALKAVGAGEATRDVDFFASALNSQEAGVRRRAVAALGNYRDISAVPVLARALKDTDPAVRVYAAEALYQFGPDAAPATSSLVAALSDRTEHETSGFHRWPNEVQSVNKLAGYALANIAQNAPDRAVPALAEALKSDDQEVHLAAARALRLAPEAEAAAPALAAALEDPSLEVAIAAARALQQFGAGARPALPGLLKHVNDEDPILRYEVCEAIWRTRSDNSEVLVRPLVGLLKIPKTPSDDPPYSDVRHDAAHLLGLIGEPAVPALSEALMHEDAQVRSLAAQALRSCGSPSLSALPVLLEVLKDPEPEVRGQAALALGRMGPEAKSAVPRLIRLLEDTNEQVSGRAAEALGRIGPEARGAVPALARTANDMRGELQRGMWGGLRRTPVRYDAAEALGRIGPEAVPAIPALVRLLRDKEEAVRFQAAEALASIGPGALPSLIDTLRSAPREARIGAAQAVEFLGSDAAPAVMALVAALDVTDVDLRHQATQALGAIGPAASDAIPALIELLDDDGQFLRTSADTGYQATVSEDASEALGKIGPAAIPALREALQGRSLHARVRAVQALHLIDPLDPSSLPFLVELLKNDRFLDDGQLEDVWFFGPADAAEILGKMGPAAELAVPVLTHALDRTADLQIAAALARIDPCHEQARQALLSALGGEEDFDYAAELIAEIGPSANWAIPHLLQAWRRAVADPEHDFEADSVVGALGAMGPGAVPALIEALNSTDYDSSEAAAEALSNMGSEASPAVPVLIKRLAGEHPDLFIQALRKIGPEASSAIPHLAQLPDLYADEAAQALANTGKASVPRLTAALRTQSLRWRSAAAQALGQIGPEAHEAIPALLAALHDPRMAVRAHSAEALGKIGTDTDRTVPALASALTDEYVEVRRRAAEALGLLGDDAKAAMPALNKALADEFQAVRLEAATAIERIEK